VSRASTLEPVARGARPAGNRVFISVLLIVSLLAAAWARDWAIADHEALRSRGRVVPASASADTSLSSMPSFATALLLGGLRGPLVMILWTSSENQKQQHDLQDFDTKVEWIRLLQPEFDTVHLFQIWNKAYNISVQMASLRNKYTTILDAIDYGQKVEKERPDDLNIITAIAMLYGDKLGTSAEHVYYRARIRRESQTLIRVSFPASRADEFKALAENAGWSDKDSPIESNERNQMDQVVIEPMIARQLGRVFTGPGVDFSPETRRESQQNDPSWRRVRLDPLVDENGWILPALLTPRYPRPADLSESQPWYDGSQLQFLKQYEPFPYGISTLALAYNDYKRAQLLQTLWNQHHIQSGDTVVDARPALTLKDWAHDEWERGRRYELQMWGQFVPESADPIELERPTAADAFDQPTTDWAAYDAALFSYALSARLFHDALDEFRVHIARYKNFASVYFVHVDDAYSGERLMLADHDYLAAATAAGAERRQLLESSASEYQAAMLHFAITVLKYYMDEPVMAEVYPKDPKTGLQYNRATIEMSDPNTYMATLQAALDVNARYFADPVTHQYSPMRDTYADDRNSYLTYIFRCQTRLRELQSALSAKP
jgi:hypothetical protein